MKPRYVLSVIWLFGLAVSLIIVAVYLRQPEDEIPFTFPDERGLYLQPIATLYGTIITGILASWFVKRFSPPKIDPEAHALFKLALICTLIWNIGTIYLIGHRLVWPDQAGTLLGDFETAKNFGMWFGFLVAPVNFYYFGIKPTPV